MSNAGPRNSRSPNNAEVILAALKCHDIEIHTSIPCRVDKFDPATQTADCKPVIRRRFQNPDGTEINESLPVIPRVPVAFPRAGRFIITWPIKPGDLVELVVTESSRDAFQAGTGIETDPDDFRRFDLSDAWANPAAGYPDSRAIKVFDPDDLVIGVDDGVVIHIKENGEIHLGAKQAADALSLATKVAAGLQDIVDAIKAGIPLANDGGAQLQTGIIAALTDPVASVASTVVKSE